MGASQAAATGQAESLESGGFFALLALAAASVSKDSSSGALQMILARPILRVEYLFGRYCGILLAYAAYLAATGGAALLLSPLLGRLFGASAGTLSVGEIVRSAAGSLLSAALFAAVLLFFSTFLRGYGDVLAYFLLSLLLAAPGALSGPLKMPWLSKLGNIARDNILPRVSWNEVLRGKNVLAPATGAFVLAVTAYLTFAAWIFSRREFTYGND
jgi:ABC-type transport system involved in multi-copper enzyme maturation permease subunit